LRRTGFRFQKKPPKKQKIKASPFSELAAKWDFNYRALLDYIDKHDGKLPKWEETYTFEGTVLPLSQWLTGQMSQYKVNTGHSELRDVRRELLEQIPAFLEKIEATYEDRLVDDLYHARAVVYYCNHINTESLPYGTNDTWVFYDQGHTNVTRKMTGSCCHDLKEKFNEGRLSDEAQLVLRGAKAWVEWADDRLRDDKRRYEFKARAVAYFHRIHGRFPRPRREWWDFSHAGIDGRMSGQWFSVQKLRYRNRIDVNRIVHHNAMRMTDEQDRQLDEWLGEPWQEWKRNEDIILAILKYKELQGEAWDGTVSESFIVPAGSKEGSEQWHKKLWGMELGQVVSNILSGSLVIHDPNVRLKKAGFNPDREAPAAPVLTLGLLDLWRQRRRVSGVK
jgi:hypothetical protein